MEKNTWKHKTRPVCLERRFEFDTYNSTRNFLDKLGELSEKTNRFPDISFGKTYVNITLRPEEEQKNISIKDHEFSMKIDELID